MYALSALLVPSITRYSSLRYIILYMLHGCLITNHHTALADVMYCNYIDAYNAAYYLPLKADPS